MTLADAAATFGPTAGFLIYLWLNRPKTETKIDDAAGMLQAILDELKAVKEQVIRNEALPQSMNEKLVRILTLLEVRK
jgi:hypothetical protein